MTSPAPARSASASTRSRNASSCPWARARSTRVARWSSGLIDHDGTSTSSLSRAHTAPANSATGCVRVSSWLLMKTTLATTTDKIEQVFYTNRARQ